MSMAMTLRDAVRESGLSERTLYQLIADGKLQSTMVGRRRLILTKSLEKVLTGGVSMVDSVAKKKARKASGSGRGSRVSRLRGASEREGLSRE